MPGRRVFYFYLFIFFPLPSRVANSGSWAADAAECPLRGCECPGGQDGPETGGICFPPGNSCFCCGAGKGPPPASLTRVPPQHTRVDRPRARGGVRCRLVAQTRPQPCHFPWASESCPLQTKGELRRHLSACLVVLSARPRGCGEEALSGRARGCAARS